MGSVALYNRLQREVDKVINKLGMTDATLRRSTGDITVRLLITEYTSAERMGRTLDPLDSKALIAAKGLPYAPQQDLDHILTYVPGSNPKVQDKRFRITSRPRPLAPGGVVLYWECSVRDYG